MGTKEYDASEKAKAEVLGETDWKQIIKSISARQKLKQLEQILETAKVTKLMKVKKPPKCLFIPSESLLRKIIISIASFSGQDNVTNDMIMKKFGFTVV